MRLEFVLIAGLLVTACGKASGPNTDILLADKPATTLAAYGLFEDDRARVPIEGLVKYDLSNPLFSDYAEKHRFIYVPEDKSATYVEDDVLAFPVGSVLVKTFAYGERYLETRLLIHKADGWEAIPYVWNEAGTEATYAPVGARIEISAEGGPVEAGAFTYAVPNKNQCKTCHQNGDVVTPIGPKARNLNHVGPHGVNQIADWQTRGLLAEIGAETPSVPAVWNEDIDLEQRARAYLDINCAHCHKATGSASNSGLWLDWAIEDAVKWGVGKHPTAAGRGSGDALVVIKPGQPEKSILAYRMASDEAGVAMPELGRALVHDEGVALIDAWIEQMEADAG